MRPGGQTSGLRDLPIPSHDEWMGDPDSLPALVEVPPGRLSPGAGILREKKGALEKRISHLNDGENSMMYAVKGRIKINFEEEANSAEDAIEIVESNFPEWEGCFELVAIPIPE